MKFRNIAALLALSTLLSACVSGDDSTPPAANPNSGFKVRYAPLGAEMPFPNDLYSGSDGKLAIPGSATVSQNAPLLALNHLDGYGTQSDISIYFTQPVDKATLASGILVFKVASSPTDKHVTGFSKQLVPGTDYSIQLSPGIDSAGEIVTIKPLHPLDASTVNTTTHVPTFSTYLVVVTTGVKDASGDSVAASEEFNTILTADTPAVVAGGNPAKIAMAATDPLFPVAEFDLGQIAVAYGAIHAANPNFALTDIAVTFSFSTQFIGVTLGDISLKAVARTGSVAPTGLTTHDLSASLPGIADVYAGTVTIPYYLSAPSANDPTAALTGFWHTASGGDTTVLDPLPKKTSDQTIPVLMTVPNAGSGCAMPGTGWPVVIFQHGITQNRTNVIAIADGMAQACFAVVAIDLPLHGITDTSSAVTTNPFYKNQLFKGTAAASLMTGERTFNMDAKGVAGATGAAVAGSGNFFINLNSTLTSRDNLREAAADLISLTRTIQGGKLTLLGGPSILDGSQIGFVGHSLGGIVGTDYLAVDPSAFAATLGMPGGHIAQLLIDSPSFATPINQGLADQGVVTGSQSYYDFLSQAQAVVEDGDPANYAAAAAAQHPIHMIEVVGDGTAANPPDQVVPNSATDVLIAEMGITTPISTVGLNAVAAGAPTLAQFTAGDHGSLLQPAASNATQLAITTEMQSEMVSLFGTGGAAVAVTDNSHLTTTLKK